INSVMSAHMALMRRYLDGVAPDTLTTGTSPTGSAFRAAAVDLSVVGKAVTASRGHSDAVETRKKFSGIDTQKAQLSAQQREFISQLAARLSARCPRSKQMAEAGKTYLSGWKYSLQFKQDLKELRFPIVCETASGSRFTDI